MPLSKIPNQPCLANLPGTTQNKGFSTRIFDPHVKKSCYRSFHNPPLSFLIVKRNINNMKKYYGYVNNNALLFKFHQGY